MGSNTVLVYVVRTALLLILQRALENRRNLYNTL